MCRWQRERRERMTIKELYDFAVDYGIEDYKILIQFRDDGGDYDGKEDAEIMESRINDKGKTITL